MNLLEFFFIISGFIIFFLALDIARKEKFNALHFFVFLCIGSGLLVFTFFPSVLNLIGTLFGLQRGADVLVYGAIIFIIYMSLLLLSKVEKNKSDITKLVRQLAIESSSKTSYSSDGVILVRVYNEVSVLKNTLESIFDAGYTNILIVNDGSTDGSYQIIEEFAKKHDHIIALHHFKNRGGGAALETGFEYVRRYLDVGGIVTFDADGQHDIGEITKFMEAFKKHPYLQIVFGSRFLKKGAYTDMPFSRKIILKGGRLFTYLMNRSKLSDPHNGYRIFKKEAVEQIHLESDGMSYASELVEKIMKYSIPHAEIPVHIRYTDYSLSKGQKSSNAIFIMFQTIWMKFFK